MRNALSAPATYRTVVFRVAGTIRLKSKLSIPANTTIAGQTAPAEGSASPTTRWSLAETMSSCALSGFAWATATKNKGKVDGSGRGRRLGNLGNKRLIIDHCSVSWSSDEALTIYRGDSVTLQWNIISEPLNYSYHFESGGSDYQEHGYGGIWGSRNGSFHHNLILHVKGRAPRFAGNSTYPAGVVEKADFRNNVIYNWRDYSTNGGEGGTYNLVNNYYKYGPSTSTGTSSGVPKRGMIMNPSKSSSLGYPKIYLSGNFVDGYSAITAANWKGMAMADGGTLADTALSKTNAPFPWDSVVTHSATEAYELVLAHAGAALPLRDTSISASSADVRNRAGRIIDVQGGFPDTEPPSTNDRRLARFGLRHSTGRHRQRRHARYLEVAQGLDPQNPSDRSGIAPNGTLTWKITLNGPNSPLIP
ncbi:MAG: pectate lyase [Haliscomenobacter sp.]|nr:pectate lyase [Haliscomenobacter sp.]